MTITNFEIRYSDVKGFEKPMPSPRPRARKVKNFIQIYMPSSYMKHKEFIKKQMPELKSDKKIKLTALFMMPIPKATPKYKVLELLGFAHTKKPDLDNLIKTFMDAANGHVWIDDGQVFELHTKKIYSDTPKIKIKLEEI
ncbi:RusA family crossover junction endodeoxyribonuclease [Macrococcoides goetzii]|uniref:RusA family crossover junction endodeoxyribonuclease n=1 Tax=Macrococcoides goetzii TaxID=1891097 RepID=A0A2G5NUQ4_9STAP|nr:RusA family crossover junction endodeoxyribonuclease [Macrococcus goetzii]RAI79689.1 RusA family crossover junction endodeoxyribonuclease [Macrococcus goetzii]